MTKPKAKTTNAKKTSPLAKKGKLAFVQPELNSTQTIGEALDEIRQGKVNSAFSTKKPNTDLTNDVNVQELFKNHVPTGPSQYDQLETQLATVEEELKLKINDSERSMNINLNSLANHRDLTYRAIEQLNFKVNVAITLFTAILLVNAIWYWFT